MKYVTENTWEADRNRLVEQQKPIHNNADLHVVLLLEDFPVHVSNYVTPWTMDDGHVLSAYTPWTETDDKQLIKLHSEGRSDRSTQIVKTLGIQSRFSAD